MTKQISPTFQDAPLRDLRKSVQVVLQDPYGALNPRLTVGAAIAEGLIIQGICKQEATQRAYELLSLTDLTENAFDRYPQEFSGGQRQRICIARALALNPELLIADEAVSALDVSIQDKILQLLADLQKKLNFAMIFITHDLRVARVICDEVIVMKSGKVVESGRASEVLERPVHSYTRFSKGSAAFARNRCKGASMTQYILSRLIRATVTLLITVTLVFIFIRFSGDPAAALAPPDAPQEVIEQYREQMGLDQPFHFNILVISAS